MTEDELKQEVAKRQWYHSIPLPYGIVTPGVQAADAWQRYRLPKNLEGKTVLDIGAWEGQFSFEAERRGAARVLAIDVWGESKNPGSWGAGFENFQFCRELLGSNVEYKHLSVYDLDWSSWEFDYVLLLSVIYHLQDPFLGIRKAASVCNEFLALESWVDALDVEEPAMVFYEDGELAGDNTNWWGPNPACIKAMLRAAGFVRVEQVWEKKDGNLGGRGERVCFHAFKH